MSLSSALAAAVTGLSASSRAASLISSNLSNATTEGYGVRRLETSSFGGAGMQGGVRIDGVRRAYDPVLTGQRMEADAEAGNAGPSAGFYTELEALIGTPGDGASLSAVLADFETNLIAGSNAPDSDAQLASILRSAEAVASKLGTISEGIQAARERADAEISTTVRTINSALSELDRINEDILTVRSAGGDESSLLDQQQQLLNSLSEAIPLRTLRNSNGQLAIYSQDGVQLLDGTAAVLGFSPTPVITADMTLASGALSGLTVNGRALPNNGGEPALSGGSLSALFDLRDTVAVGAQSQADAVARDLVERFEAADPTLAPGDAGLFTDAGGPFDATDEPGLAGRLTLNTSVDPSAGGDLWRLREGLMAAGPGPAGDAGILRDLAAALDAPRVTASGGFTASERGLPGLAAEFLSSVSFNRQDAETAQSFAIARRDSLLAQEAAQGVNSDEELQRLLLVEQMFAANARLIEVVGDMLDELRRI